MIVIVFCHIIFEGGSQFSKNSPLTDLHSYTGCGERGGQCGGRERARPRAAAAAGQSAEPALGQDLAAGQDQRLVPDLPRGRGGHGPGRCTVLYLHCTVLYCTVRVLFPGQVPAPAITFTRASLTSTTAESCCSQHEDTAAS